MARTPPAPLNASDHSDPARPSAVLLGSIVIGLLLPFMVLTYLAVRPRSPSEAYDRPVVLTTLATIAGPFTGAIARHGQSCCLDSSLRIAAFCGPILLVGVVAPVVPLPFRRGSRFLRVVLWTIGWTAWLLGGPVSFVHALS